MATPSSHHLFLISSYQKGVFRSSVAYWVGGGEMSAIESMEDLERRVKHGAVITPLLKNGCGWSGWAELRQKRT
jgi:hypothetical protein